MVDFDMTSYAGRYLRYYKPRVNIHSLINSLVRPRAFSTSAVIVQQKRLPDVSFYQGLIDWDRMRVFTDAVIIRAGQNMWVDSQFNRNWAEAKSHGMKRGAYWFYDDRIDPGRQADLCISLFQNDPPEIEIFADWERSYGGGFGGLANVVSFMERVESAGYKTGFYTGYYWFRDNSNAITNASQYNYLKARPLWLAWYTSNPANVLIPPPWTSLTFWQYGTPVLDWGQQTSELDMNYYNGTETEFNQRYGGQPPTGGKMQGTCIKAVNIRDGSTSNVVVGGLRVGDVVYGEVRLFNGLDRLFFNKIYRTTGSIDIWAEGSNSAVKDANNVWLKLADVPEPGTEPPPPVKVALVSGNLDYNITSGELKATATYADGSTLSNVYPKEK